MITIEPTVIPKPVQIGLVLAGAAAAVVTGRLLRKRNSGPSERLAAAMLDTTLLESARRDSLASPLLALTACAGYVAHLIKESAADSGLARSRTEAVGSSCRVTHPYSGAIANVFTQRSRPDESLVYTMDFAGVCSVRGARTVSSIALSGITPSHKVRDQVQLELGELYTVQVETDFNVAEFVSTGSNRIQGEMTVDDGRGNSGRLTIQVDGSVSGPVRNGVQVLGRFSGSVAGGIQFVSFSNASSHNSSNVSGEASA